MIRLLIFLLCSTILSAQNLALVHARIYTSPDAALVADGVIVVRNGWIAEVGPSSSVAAPVDVRIIDCTGLTALAGYWNSHVHFTEDKWRNARAIPSDRLAAQLVEMFGRHGFTSVFDTGSETANTMSLRSRIGMGEVPGPMILTTGTPLAPEDGTPYYLKPDRLPEVKTSDQAVQLVRERLGQGVDAIKIFSGSWVSTEKVVAMPVEVVTAAVSEAHRYGLRVFAHPSNAAGIEAAVAGGVDILAHSEEVPGTIDSGTMARMKAQNMALIPTLKLFSMDSTLPNILRQVKAYADLGGEILFGTDAGYLTDYDPTEEFRLMARSGLTVRQILASLTTRPAERFGFELRKGKIVAGMDGDLVLVGGDPADSISSLADVRYCIRGGRILYASAGD